MRIFECERLSHWQGQFLLTILHFPFCQIKPPAVYGNQWALPDDDPDCQNEDETKDPPVCDDTNHLQEAERMCTYITDDEGEEVKDLILVHDGKVISLGHMS